jgi:hypothetical protein
MTLDHPVELTPSPSGAIVGDAIAALDVYGDEDDPFTTVSLSSLR